MHEPLTWTTVDKRAWGDGPWQTEPDKVQWVDPETNLDCLIVRNRVGSLCGYVGVPETHPLYGKDYEVPAVEVHGGLTFADVCQEATRERWEQWRAALRGREDELRRYPRGDLADELRERARQLNDYDAWRQHEVATAICHVPLDGRPAHVWWFGFDTAHWMDYSPKMEALLASSRARSTIDIYRDLTYVQSQCAQLAGQLATITPTATAEAGD